MSYFTQDVVTPEGVTKKQFYKSTGMQDFTTGDIVQVRQWVGEYTQADLIGSKENIQGQLDNVNDILTYFTV